MTFWSFQLAGNSVLPGLPVPCRCPPPYASPSRMWVERSGLMRIVSGARADPGVYGVPAGTFRSGIGLVIRAGVC